MDPPAARAYTETMNTPSPFPLTIYYDGACPVCRRERERYTRWLGEQAGQVIWFDITGQEERLRAEGIDPAAALTALHVRDARGRIHRDIPAYVLLLGAVPRWRWLGHLMGLPGIRHVLSALYGIWVRRRLKREGRLPGQCPVPGHK